MYKLFPDTIITRGFFRDLLLDFSRSELILLPKEISSIIYSIQTNRELTPKEIDVIPELISKEIIFELDSDELPLFPDLKLDWDFPAEISNAVIEIGNRNISYLNDIFEQLESLNCFYFSIILAEPLSNSDLQKVKTIFLESSIVCNELVIAYNENEALENFLSSIILSPRFQYKAKVFNCTNRRFIDKFKDFIILKEGIYSSKHCGCISEDNFNINIYMFTESQKYNTCLNRKVSVDMEGNIKNCLNFAENFGHVETHKISEVIRKEEFKKLWAIKKDDIQICKICEFRYICTDCRAFVENPKDIFSKPLKCGYNPYSGEWENWSQSPLKKGAIHFYDL